MADEAAAAAEREEDEEVGDGEPLTLRDCLVVGANVELHYSIGLLPFAVGEEASSCEVIGVTELGPRVVVAVPHGTWARKGPALAFAGSTRMGDVGQEANVTFDGTAAPEFTFGQDPNGVALCPHAPSLAAACSEAYGYHSAESAAAEDPLSSRVDKLESAITKIAAGVKALIARDGGGPPGPNATVSAKTAKSKARPEPKAAAPLADFPHLDPGVARAALDSGVSLSALAEMDNLMRESGAGRNPRRPPGLRKASNVLSESEGDEQPEPAEPAAVTAANPADAVSLAISQLASVVQALAKDKVRNPGTGLDKVLDAPSGASGSVDSATSSRRTGAARRALKSALTDQPEILSRSVEELMKEDLHALQTPGYQGRVSARAWLEHRSRIGAYQTMVKCAWSAAGALDALRQQKPAEAEARLSLLLVALDQVAVDRGNWALGSEILLEAPAPMHAFKGHESRDSDQVFSRILDSRLAELSLHYLKDQADFLEKRNKLGRRSPAPPGETSKRNSPAPSRSQKQSRGPTGRSECPAGGLPSCRPVVAIHATPCACARRLRALCFCPRFLGGPPDLGPSRPWKILPVFPHPASRRKSRRADVPGLALPFTLPGGLSAWLPWIFPLEEEADMSSGRFAFLAPPGVARRKPSWTWTWGPPLRKATAHGSPS
eukprot:s4323_g6.t1